MSRMATPEKHPKSGVYYFRMAVPKDLIPIIGKTAFKTSLKTKSLAEAKRLFPSYLEEAHREIELARLKLSDEPSVNLTVKDCVILAERWYIRIRDRMEASGDFTEILVRDAEWCDGKYRYHEFGLSDTLPISGSEIVRATEAQLKELAEDLRGHIEGQLDIEGIAVPFGCPSFIQLARSFYPYIPRLESLCRARYKDDWTYQPIRCELAGNALSIVIEESQAPLKSVNNSSRLVKKTNSITTVLDAYIELEKSRVSVKGGRLKTLDETDSKVRSLVKIIGDLDVSAVQRSDIVKLRDTLGLMPSSGGKSVKNKAPEEQIRIAEERGLNRYAPNSVKKALKLLSTVFTHAMDMGLITHNPVNGVKVKAFVDKSETKEDRGYSEAEIELAFQDEIFHSTKISTSYGMASYWIPILCRYTGARINEIAQLRKEDVIVTGEGLAHLYLREGEDQNLKSPSSVREIPVPKHIVELGFLEYANKQTNWLFPKLRPNKYGNRGVKIGQWWTDIVRGKKIKISQPSHGFRHAFKTFMRSLSVEDSVSDAITGHAAVNEGGRYGMVTIETKRAAIDKLPRLNLKRIW